MVRKRSTPEVPTPSTSRKKRRVSTTSGRSISARKPSSTRSKRRTIALKQPRSAPPAMEAKQITPPPREIQSPPPAKKQKKRARFADPISVSFPIASAAQSPRTPRKPARYTFEFFQDMAETIACNFPFEAFSAKHGVSLHDVSQALSALVVAPLTDPAFLWHDEPDMTIPEYGETMIKSWNDHYKAMLIANSAAAAIDLEDDPVRSENSDEDSRDPSNDMTSTDTNRSQDVSPSIQPKEDTDFTLSVQVPETTTKQTLKSSPSRNVQRAPYPKWTPPETPAVRQHMYRDEFGNYTPVPTAEEEEEHQRRQWGMEQSQRNRQNRRRSHRSMPKSESPSVDAEFDLEEMFERELAAHAMRFDG